MNEEYQTTDNIIGLNNQSFHILYRDSVVIEPVVEGIGFGGFAQIDINHILATVANPEFDIYEYIEAGAPGYQKYLVKSPRTIPDANDGTIEYTSNANLYWDMGKTGVSIIISFWHKFDSRPRTFYLNVRGTSITNGNVFTP